MLTMTITSMSSFAAVFASVCRSVSPAIRAGTSESNASVRQERVTHMTTTPTPSVHNYKDHLNQLEVTFENRFDNIQHSIDERLHAMNMVTPRSPSPSPATSRDSRSRSPSPKHRSRHDRQRDLDRWPHD
jgi:hypothetical protein